MSKPINTTPYMRTSWEFPPEVGQLSVELSRSHLSIANNMNMRTIGIFPTNKPAIGGESWYFSRDRRQNLRQIYPFTAAGNITHGLDWNSVYQMTKCSGSFTDGTNWYGAIYASNVAIAGQVSFYVTNTNIVVLSGAGAPVIQSGTIVLEWISQV